MPATDTTQLLALIVAKRCLEDACRGDFSHIDRIGCLSFLVRPSQEIAQQHGGPSSASHLGQPLREHGIPGQVGSFCSYLRSLCPLAGKHFSWFACNVIAGRIANRLDLGGTNCVTDAALPLPCLPSAWVFWCILGL